VLEEAVEGWARQSGAEAHRLFRARNRSQNRNTGQNPRSPRKIGVSGAGGRNLFLRRGVLIEPLRFDRPERKKRRRVPAHARREYRTSFPA
jgi:hypothetical protein